MSKLYLKLQKKAREKRKKNALFVLTKVLNDSNLFFIFLLFSVFSTVFLKKPQKCRPEHSRRQRRSVSPGNCISSAERNTSAETVKRRAEKRKIHASGVALHRIPFSPLAVLPAGVRKDQVVHIVEIPPIPIHHTAPSFLSEDYRIQYSRVGSRLQGQEYTVYIKFLQSFCAGFFSQ